MPNNTAKMIELPPELQAFAEERVRAGKSSSVDDVVRDALEQKKLLVLREALDVGIAELDAGLGVENAHPARETQRATPEAIPWTRPNLPEGT